MMMILIKKRHMYFFSKLSFSLSLSLSNSSFYIISVVLSVNVLLIISVVCFCVFEKKCCVVVVKFLFFSCRHAWSRKRFLFAFLFFLLFFCFFFVCFFSHQTQTEEEEGFRYLLFHRFFISKRE